MKIMIMIIKYYNTIQTWWFPWRKASSPNLFQQSSRSIVFAVSKATSMFPHSIARSKRVLASRTKCKAIYTYLKISINITKKMKNIEQMKELKFEKRNDSKITEKRYFPNLRRLSRLSGCNCGRGQEWLDKKSSGSEPILRKYKKIALGQSWIRSRLREKRRCQ